MRLGIGKHSERMNGRQRQLQQQLQLQLVPQPHAFMALRAACKTVDICTKVNAKQPKTNSKQQKDKGQ